MPHQVHATVTSRPTADSAQRTDDDDLVDQAIDDAIARAAEETLDTTDDLLDEIDAILTEEEEFAIRYVQRGGQ